MATNGHHAAEYFPFATKKIPFLGPKSQDPLSFKDYNADEVILGRTMRDWLRFSVCAWHTFRANGTDPFGSQTIFRAWPQDDNTAQPYDKILADCKARLDALFEFTSKLGAPYYTFHDRDVSPELGTLAETERLFDDVSDYMLKKQNETGVKLLWGTSNLFSHPRYAAGAATSPSLEVFAAACAQVKKCMEVTKKLGGVNYVFWGGREGYQSLLNTDLAQEQKQLAAFMRMARDHRNAIGADFQLLIEPKPREPTKHQYDYDAQTVIGFLRGAGLEKDFKLNIEPNHTTLAGHAFEHDLAIAAALGFLGSVDCNTGDEMLGWDTDQFLTDDRRAAAVMKIVIDMGGLGKGGMNFDAKVRRESTDPADLFIAHIGGMDTLARGLRHAAAIIQSGRLPQMVKQRYASWDSELGRRVVDGKAGLGDLRQLLEERTLKGAAVGSGKQELFEMVFNEEIRQTP